MGDESSSALPRWVSHYPPSVPRQPMIPEITLPQMLDEAVARFPQAVALSFEGTDLTYLQLRIAVGQLATAFTRLEVNPGDRVAFVAPNCPQLVIGMYAAMRIGAVAVPLNPHASPEQLHADLVETNADVVLCVAQAAEAVQQARRDTGVRTVVVTRLSDALSSGQRLRLATRVGSRRRRAELRGDVKKLPPRTVWLRDVLTTAGLFPPQVAIKPSDAAVILYTAGGSGTPRPVALSHRSLVASAYQTAWWLPGARAGHETTLGLLPLFHVFGLTLGLNTTILLGGTFIPLPVFEPSGVLSTLADGTTYFPAIPAVIRALLDRRDLRPQRTSALRETFAAGSVLPAETAAAFKRMTSSTVAAAYGMTETAGLTHARPFSTAGDEVNVGVPLPLTEMKVVDLTAAKRAVRPGAVGELLVRGPQVRDVDLDADGFFHTGDLVSVDDEGRTSFVCRADDVIQVGRQRVWPNVVEAPVLALPQVARAAAVQGYTASGTRQIKLVVELMPGSHLDSGMILQVCERELASGLVPGEIEIHPGLPLTGTGDVLRRLLRSSKPPRTTTSDKSDKKALS